MPIKTLQAKTKKLTGTPFGGYIGYEGNPTWSLLAAPNFTTVDGHLGIAGVFVAGADSQGLPQYTGFIKKMKTKTGAILGEAHISPMANPIKFSPADAGGSFVIHTAAP